MADHTVSSSASGPRARRRGSHRIVGRIETGDDLVAFPTIDPSTSRHTSRDRGLATRRHLNTLFGVSDPIEIGKAAARACASPTGSEPVPSHLFVTDLDGTLLDHDTYDWRAAAPALAELARRGLPLVLASSKTVAEIVELRSELDLRSPVIAENGAVVALPDDTLPHAGDAEGIDDLRLHVLGAERGAFLPVLHDARRKHHLPFEGFADWSAEEVADRTGLPLARARLALERRGTEPVAWSGDAAGLSFFRTLLANEGLDLLAGGRFHHVSGGSDKARALAWLRRRYSEAWPASGTTVVALGDSPNDATMLSAADVAVVMPARTPRPFEVSAPRVLRAEREGPRGWSDSVLELLRAVGD